MRADRLLLLILQLQEGGKTTATRLAHHLGVSRRTILRDLDALSLSGVPVLAEGGPGGGVWLDPAYRTSLTGMKESEIRSLLVNTEGGLLEDLGWGESLRAGQRKLRASGSVRLESSLEFVRQRLVIDSRWWWHETPDSCLETLQTAVWNDRCIEGVYEGWEGRARTVTLEAYGLAAKAGLWYFVGRRDEWRLYRVSRFTSVQCHSPFRRDPQFDLHSWWKDHAQEFSTEFSGYRFRLALPEERLRYLRQIAPGRITLMGPWEEKAGWVAVEVGLDSSLYAELVVLGLGRDGVILDPPELRAAVVQRAQEAVDALTRPS